MPFIKDDSLSNLPRLHGTDALPPEEKPVSFSDELTAAYRLENTLGSFIAKQPDLPDKLKSTDYDSWQSLSDDEKLNKNFVEQALFADNEIELEAVRKQFTQENMDRETLQSSYLAPFIMGSADLINFIPVGGVAFRTYKTGGSILSGAVATGSVAAGSTAITEAALHHTQLTRTLGESAVNVGAATFLGGIIGAAPGAVKALANRTGRTEKQLVEEIELVMNPEQAVTDGVNPATASRSMGAAQVEADPQVRGRLARAATKFIGFDPYSATATSEAKSTRYTVNSLAESPLDMDTPLGQAVETAIKLHDGKFFKATEGHMKIFNEYKSGGGELARRDFAQAVGKAVRNGSDDPQIQAAADTWRKELYMPLEKEFRAAGLLPDSVPEGSTTAINYLNRSWNKEKVSRNLPEFIKKTKGWLDEQNVEKLSVQSDVERLSVVMQESQTQARKLRSSLDTEKGKLGKSKKMLEEVQRAEKATIERAFKTKGRFAKTEAARKRIEELDKESKIQGMIEESRRIEGEFKKGKKPPDVIRGLEQEIETLSKSETVAKMAAKSGGLNRESFQAEGIDPEFFKDRGNVFGKPLWPKNGVLTPDGLAERLNEEGFLGGGLTANDAVRIVTDMESGSPLYLDGSIESKIDFIGRRIDELSSEPSPDAFLSKLKNIDIEEEIRFQEAIEAERLSDAPPLEAGVFGELPQVEKIGAPTTKTGRAGLTGRRSEIGIAESRQRKRANDLHDRISGLNHTIKDLETRIKKLDEDALDSINQLEKSVSKWPGKSGNAVRSMIGSRDGVAAKNASKALLDSIKKLNNVDLEAIDTEDIATQIAGRVMSTPDGRLPYDYKIGDTGTGSNVKNNLSGPFQKKAFLIPDELMEDFLENDIEVLAARYLKSTAPDLELTKRFGDVEMKAELKQIEDEWLKKMKEEPDAKKREKLNKQKDKDIKNIAAMRDRIRGTYGEVDHNNPWVRAGRVARDLNYMRLLGGVVASSFSDVARIVAAEGIANTFRHGLKPLVSNIKGFKVAAHEAKLWGVGTDALMGGRAEILADVADYSAGGTAFERGVRAAATKFSSINLMNQWTGGMKQLHAVTMQTRLIPELRRGKIDRRLAQLGIDDANARNIGEELRKHATEVDGVWLANVNSWDHAELGSMWGGAIRKESDRVIIMPGQEKPLFMSSELGKTVGQFKTFMFSATQRILISNLQRQDSHYIQGMLAMVSLGMMTYAFKNWDAKREISDDPAVWVSEGIDRSGMLGILMEANNTIEKISGNSMGMRPLLGINTPASRYASRSALDSAVGPTFGLLGTVLDVAGGVAGDRPWEQSDTRALRRLLPGQNLSIIRQGLDEAEKAIQ